MRLRQAVERMTVLLILWALTLLPGLFLLGVAIGSRLRGGSDRCFADHLARTP